MLPHLPKASFLIAIFALLLGTAWVESQETSEKIVLFNGKNLDGWMAEGAKDYKDKDVLKQVWSVQDGNIFCDGKGFGFLRYTPREFSDFHFHVEFKMKPKANSGIGIRTVPFDPKRSTDTRPSYACYEIQLIDDAGKPASKHSTGSLYRYAAPSTNAHKPAGEWNAMDIECVGSKIKITFNDQKIIDVDQATLAEIMNKPTKGFLCLQNHGGKIEFRNLWVRDLAKAK